MYIKRSCYIAPMSLRVLSQLSSPDPHPPFRLLISVVPLHHYKLLTPQTTTLKTRSETHLISTESYKIKTLDPNLTKISPKHLFSLHYCRTTRKVLSRAKTSTSRLNRVTPPKNLANTLRSASNSVKSGTAYIEAPLGSAHSGVVFRRWGCCGVV